MICAIILAAGRSRRMGTQKLLLPLGGVPMIAHIVDQSLRSPVDRIYIVVGPDSIEVRKALADRTVEWVVNPIIESEMLDSVRCGLRALPGQCKAALVVLGDQPGLTSELIALLIHSFESTGRGVVLPAHAGKRGHPLLISMKYRQEILAQYNDTGLRGLLKAHAEDLFEAPALEILDDIDLPEDYHRMTERWKTTNKVPGS